jgi:ribosomal protein S6
MQERELSSNPDIRDVAHFEGHLSPQEFNKAITRPIPDDAIADMKQIGYKILEFGPYNWADVQDALQVYKNHHGDVNVPLDYVLDAEQYVENIGYNEKYEGLLLGEAVEGIRTGDIDGLEDPERRQFLDDLDFDKKEEVKTDLKKVKNIFENKKTEAGRLEARSELQKVAKIIDDFEKTYYFSEYYKILSDEKINTPYSEILDVFDLKNDATKVNNVINNFSNNQVFARLDECSSKPLLPFKSSVEILKLS